MCDENSISNVELRDRSQVNDKDEYQVIEQWPVGKFTNQIATTVIPSDSAFPTRLGDGQYMLWSTVSGLFPTYVSGPIFGAPELEGLHEGEILTSTATSMDNVIYLNLNEMASAVKEYCG